MRTLHTILRKDLKLSDAAFAKECKLDRTQVHRYRTGRAVPRGDHQQIVVSTLVRLGIEVPVAEIGSLFRTPPSARAEGQPSGPPASDPAAA